MPFELFPGVACWAFHDAKWVITENLKLKRYCPICENKEKIMFQKLFSAIPGELPLETFKFVVNDLWVLVSHFEQDYFKDKDARNAAIDALCEILQSHKK